MRWRMWLQYKTNLHNSLSYTLLQNKTVAKGKQQETNAKCLTEDKAGKIKYNIWLGMVAYFKHKPETGTEKVYIYIVCIPKWIRHCVGSHCSNAALYSTRSTLEKSYSSPANYACLLLVTNTRPSSDLQLVSTPFRCAQGPAEVSFCS